jgi:CDP-2,3-bis-(O-geranylgeranyl)-sn-glycerol synthase
MQFLLILKLLFLLLVANGAPVLAARVLGRHLSIPLDGGAKLADGRPLFGPSKTLRGVVLAVGSATACAPLLGLDWAVGAVVGIAAMAGDLFSSFVKRRMGLPSSGKATGLDQVPEALLPLLACSFMLDLGALDIIAGALMFFLADVILSIVFFRLGVRDRPH